MLSTTVEFSGGLETIFANKKTHKLNLDDDIETSSPRDLKYLINYISENLIQGHKQDIFLLDGSVRPGILVLINDTDWELEGGPDYVLQDGDNVLFVSTLHGG